MKKILFVILFICSISIFATNDQVNFLPGLGKVAQKQYAGYASISSHKKLFYWFVSSHKKNAPIILWSNGGPGYSSLYGFFKETGPYEITASMQLKNRKHGWNHFSNYMVIDQPLNVGLSDIKSNEFDKTRHEAIDDYYKTLRWFFKKHPAYQHRAIYLAGESYAGTYLPLLASKILMENKIGNKINLKGLILISPWADPLRQQSMDSAYAVSHGFITKNQKQKIDKIFLSCKKLLRQEKYLQANIVCGNIGTQIQSVSKVANLANTAYARNDNNDLLDGYVNQSGFLKAVHAVDSLRFRCFSNSVSHYFQGDIQKSVKHVYEKLLSEGVPILIFSGLNDMKDTNFFGINQFVGGLNWPAKSQYIDGNTKSVEVNIDAKKEVIGYLQSGGGLTWVKVLNSGHMVPQDQQHIDKIVKDFVKKNH